MKVRDGMSPVVLTIGPAHTLRESARLMSGRGVGAAVVIDPENCGIGIITERDVLDALGAGEDPDSELVSAHLTDHLIFAAPDWTLEQAAKTMIDGGFRHLVVVDGDDVVGLLSMRDIVRCWAAEGVGQATDRVATV